jgi:hypothetical protein
MKYLKFIKSIIDTVTLLDILQMSSGLVKEFGRLFTRFNKHMKNKKLAGVNKAEMVTGTGTKNANPTRARAILENRIVITTTFLGFSMNTLIIRGKSLVRRTSL